MIRNRHLSPLQALAVKWQLIGLLAVAFARLLRRYEDTRAHGTGAQAEQLAVTLRTAHCLMTEDVEEALGGRTPQTEEDERALAYLHRIALCLLALSFVATSIRRRALSPACWRDMGAPHRRKVIASYLLPVGEAAFLDSS